MQVITETASQQAVTRLIDAFTRALSCQRVEPIGIRLLVIWGRQGIGA